MQKILHIHVKKKYWLQVKDKVKNKEYRLIKPYWIKRLKKEYDLIYYWCAYTSKKLIFKYNGYVRTTIKHEEFGDKPVNVFAIDLTKHQEMSSMVELNKVYHRECMDFLKDVPDKSVDLIIIDPPYNIKKDSWDDIENYETWLKSVLIELQRVLKENGSFYMFHSEMEVVADLMQWFRKETNLIFRQFIVWNKRFRGSKNKGFLDGYVEVGDLRNYQQMAEYILYYTFQDETGLSKIMGHCVYPIRDYIRSEIKRAKGKIVLKEINQVLGTATNGGGVASATLSLDKTCPAMITEEHYLKLRAWLNEDLRKEYSYLRKEYSYLRKEYEDLRYTFNNQKSHHSVWNYDIAKKKGHITPKPLPLIDNIIKHSSKKGDVVLDVFMGSGTTAISARRCSRNFMGCDKDDTYIEIINKRLSQKLLNFESYESHKPEVNLCLPLEKKQEGGNGIPPTSKEVGILPKIL